MRNTAQRKPQIGAVTRVMLAATTFWSHVVKSDTCWLWTGAQNGNGYALYSMLIDGVRRYCGVHRLAYMALVGPIPKGFQIDHLCRVRNCVNPAHLEAVTQLENTMRGFGFAAVNARKTCCRSGHPLSGDNLYVRPNGDRDCRICKRINLRRWQQRQLESLSNQSTGIYSETEQGVTVDAGLRKSALHVG